SVPQRERRRRSPRRRCRGSGRGRGDAPRAPEGAGGQLLHGRRSRVRRVRRPGHGILGAARIHHLPGVHELRPVAHGRRDGSTRPRPAGRERAAVPSCGRAEADRAAPLLRTLRGRRRMAEDAGRHRRRFPEPVSATQQSAYDKWLDQTSTREEARRDRVHGAVGVMPPTLWIVLFFISAVIFAYMLFFADSGESAVTQGMLMGSVASVITVMLLLLWSLDRPFHTGVGGLKPVAMERSLRVLDEVLPSLAPGVSLPCDAEGRPL